MLDDTFIIFGSYLRMEHDRDGNGVLLGNIERVERTMKGESCCII